MPGNVRGGAWGGGGGQLLSQQQPAVAHVPFAMRLSTNPKLQARLCTDEGADDFAAAAYAWIVADQAYCRSFVAEGRSTSGCDSGRTRLAAEAKRESRLRLDAVCQRRGLGSWGASAWARDIAKAHYERMARHAAVLRESVVERARASSPVGLASSSLSPPLAAAAAQHASRRSLDDTPEHGRFARAREIRDSCMSPSTDGEVDDGGGSGGGSVQQQQQWRRRRRQQQQRNGEEDQDKEGGDDDAEDETGVAQQLLAIISCHTRMHALLQLCPTDEPPLAKLRDLCGAFVAFAEADESYLCSFVANTAEGIRASANAKKMARDELDALLRQCGFGEWGSAHSRRARKLLREQYVRVLQKHQRQTAAAAQQRQGHGLDRSRSQLDHVAMPSGTRAVELLFDGGSSGSSTDSHDEADCDRDDDVDTSDFGETDGEVDDEHSEPGGDTSALQRRVTTAATKPAHGGGGSSSGGSSNSNNSNNSNNSSRHHSRRHRRSGKRHRIAGVQRPVEHRIQQRSGVESVAETESDSEPESTSSLSSSSSEAESEGGHIAVETVQKDSDRHGRRPTPGFGGGTSSLPGPVGVRVDPLVCPTSQSSATGSCRIPARTPMQNLRTRPSLITSLP
eukprot:COSAG01_NODE_4124_length_5329_cov_4.678394_4_plen_622_part_00